MHELGPQSYNILMDNVGQSAWEICIGTFPGNGLPIDLAKKSSNFLVMMLPGFNMPH